MDAQAIWSQIITLISTFVTFGGAIWAIWGIVVLAGGLKDKNGPALQSGIWQIVGGILIIAAGVFFGSLANQTITVPIIPKTT